MQMAELGGRLIPRDDGPRSGPAATSLSVIVSGCQVGAVRPDVQSASHLDGAAVSTLSGSKSVGLPVLPATSSFILGPSVVPDAPSSPSPPRGKKVVVVGSPNGGAARARIARSAVLLCLLSIAM